MGYNSNGFSSFFDPNGLPRRDPVASSLRAEFDLWPACRATTPHRPTFKSRVSGQCHPFHVPKKMSKNMSSQVTLHILHPRALAELTNQSVWSSGQRLVVGLGASLHGYFTQKYSDVGKSKIPGTLFSYTHCCFGIVTPIHHASDIAAGCWMHPIPFSLIQVENAPHFLWGSLQLATASGWSSDGRTQTKRDENLCLTTFPKLQTWMVFSSKKRNSSSSSDSIAKVHLPIIWSWDSSSLRCCHPAWETSKLLCHIHILFYGSHYIMLGFLLLILRHSLYPINSWPFVRTINWFLHW